MSGVPVVGSVAGGGRSPSSSSPGSTGFIAVPAIKAAMAQVEQMKKKKATTKKKKAKKKAPKKVAGDATGESAASGGRPYSKSNTVLGGSLGSEESVRRATLLGG